MCCLLCSSPPSCRSHAGNWAVAIGPSPFFWRRNGGEGPASPLGFPTRVGLPAWPDRSPACLSGCFDSLCFIHNQVHARCAAGDLWGPHSPTRQHWPWGFKFRVWSCLFRLYGAPKVQLPGFSSRVAGSSIPQSCRQPPEFWLPPMASGSSSSSSLVSRAKTAIHSAAAKAEKVLTDIRIDLKNDRERGLHPDFSPPFLRTRTRDLRYLDGIAGSKNCFVVRSRFNLSFRGSPLTGWLGLFRWWKASEFGEEGGRRSVDSVYWLWGTWKNVRGGASLIFLFFLTSFVFIFK